MWFTKSCTQSAQNSVIRGAGYRIHERARFTNIVFNFTFLERARQIRCFEMIPLIICHFGAGQCLFARFVDVLRWPAWPGNTQREGHKRGIGEGAGGGESREKMWLWWRGSMSLLSAYALYIIHTEISFGILHSLYMIIFVLMFIELACWLWFRIKWSSALLHCTKLQWQSLCFCRCCCCWCCRHRHCYCHRRRRHSLRRSCFILVDSFIRFSYTTNV